MADSLRENFLNALCKVDFACHQGEPNWLGLVILVVGLMVAAALLGAIIEYWRR